MSWEVKQEEEAGRKEGAVGERGKQQEGIKERQKGRFGLRWEDWHMGVAR